MGSTGVQLLFVTHVTSEGLYLRLSGERQMRHFVRMSIVVSFLAALPACRTTPTSHYLDAEARPHIKNVDSLLIAKQNEVGADIKTSKLSQYLQGHIIPVLFDIGVN